MAYIGAQPRLGNFQACDAITTSATTTFNLLVGGTAIFPQSAQHCLVSLNGVLQAPISSYTISGSTIIFAAALTTDDSIDFITILGDTLDLGTPSDSTVTSAKLNTALLTGATDIGAAIADADLFLVDDGAGGTLRKTAASRIKTYVGGGITMADQFRLSADQSGGTNAIVTSNLERVDTDGFGQLGTGMTESSGVFTFPSTGIYLIQLIGFINIRADGAGNVSIETTTDNSTFTDACIVTAGNNDSSGAQQSVAGNFIFDVTNTSTHKFHLKTHSMASGSYLMGETDRNRTAITIIRLGDTWWQIENTYN